MAGVMEHRKAADLYLRLQVMSCPALEGMYLTEPQSMYDLLCTPSAHRLDILEWICTRIYPPLQDQFSSLKESQVEIKIKGESSVHPAPSAETRLSLERFTLHKMLGIGGFGKVLLASDKETKKLLALKIVRKVDLICEDPDTALIEQRALKISSGCRFFTKLHGTFQTQSHLCYAMEYLHGGDLDCYIKRNRMTIRATTFFAAELVCGLQFLHSEGIIHRDLKPQNILLDTVGHIRIADFGLAFQVKDGMMSAEGHVGTNGFIAPEVRKGERYNAAVDWWSCGAVLYQMAKRLCHHEDLTYDECGRRATKDIIKKLLSKDPSERLGFVRSIHCHPFFQNIDWKKLEAGNVIPPFILSTPSLDSVRSLVMKESMVLDYALPLSDKEQQLFLGFSFVNSQCDIFHH